MMYMFKRALSLLGRDCRQRKVNFYAENFYIGHDGSFSKERPLHGSIIQNTLVNMRVDRKKYDEWHSLLEKEYGTFVKLLQYERERAAGLPSRLP